MCLQAYVTNLNASLEKYHKAEASGNVAEMVALQQAIRFNGGGHVNHSIFWENLAPSGKGGGGEPEGELASAISKRWGSFDAFKKAMNAAGVGVQGSGWAWLGYNKATGGVEIAACANQDPLSLTGLTPLLGIDGAWRKAQANGRLREDLIVGWEYGAAGTAVEGLARSGSPLALYY